MLKVLPGYAHLSNRPFGTRGFWGRPWRANREFVGRVEYGVRWKMWQPNDTHRTFPVGFQKSVMTMIMASRRTESLMYLLQDEIVWFIMNKCSWDWWGTETPAALAASAAATASASRDGDEAGPSRSRHSGYGGYGSSSYHNHALYESLLGGGAHSLAHFFGGTQVSGALDSDDDEEYEYAESDEDEDDDEEEDEDEDDEEDEDEEDEDEEEGVDEEESEQAGNDDEEGKAAPDSEGDSTQQAPPAAAGSLDITDVD